MCRWRLIEPREAARVLVVSQVDGAHRRHRAAEHAAGHRHQSIAARHGPLPALQRGRGRAQHQRHLLDFAAGQGHVAGVVARRGLLLESRLVLLIQDHQAQVRHRGEDRTASADDHLHLAVGNPLPLPMPFGVAEVAVQHGHPLEPRAEPLQGLRREADFRDQHDRLPAETDHLLDGLDVDFRLAAAGNPVDQDGLLPPAVQGLEDRLEGRLLVVVEHPPLRLRGGRFLGPPLMEPFGPGDDQPLLPQGSNRGLRDFGHPGQLRGGHRLRRRQQSIEHLALLRRQGRLFQPLGQIGRGGQDSDHAGTRAAADTCRHHGFQDLPPGAEVVLGDPAGEPEHRRVEQAAGIDQARQLLQRPASHRLGFHGHEVARQRPVSAPQRRADPGACFKHLGQPVGDQVVEGSLRPFREDDRRHQATFLVVLFPGLGLAVEEDSLLVGHGVRARVRGSTRQ